MKSRMKLINPAIHLERRQKQFVSAKQSHGLKSTVVFIPVSFILHQQRRPGNAFLSARCARWFADMNEIKCVVVTI